MVLGGCLLGLGVAGPARAQPPSQPSASATRDAPTQQGEIVGIVVDKSTGGEIEGALVLLQCACIQGTREASTDGLGRFRFTELPPGNYTVQVLYGEANSAQVTELPRGARFRARFLIDPSDALKRVVVVRANAVRSDANASTHVDLDAARDVPVGGGSRDFTAVVDLAPTATADAAGIRLSGTGGDESKYSVDGANVTNPSFGTVGATIVQEFIQTVEVSEAGFDAEFGGASGGLVQARRRRGSNELRGQAVVRYSPRLAQPRLITETDEALRASVFADHAFQGVVTLTGPLVRDRLFFAVGVAPGGGLNSLVQSFYRRVDRDGSGGFASCPYKNGDNDCVAGGNYIQTEKFAEQRFPTWVFDLGFFARVDWVISPKHMLTLSGGGGPRWHRTSYRLPNDEVPTTFGTNPFRTLGGSSRVATGVVNDHFGMTLSNATQVGLSYNGRVAKDKVEIDAGVSFFQSRYTEAWRLDNPSLKDLPLTQESSTQGRDLYEFLDSDAALNAVPGVSEACNGAAFPGVDCPIRMWLSGGLGQYNEERSRRVEGQLSVSHFFDIASTAHQLKYGFGVEHVERDSVSTYSGSNAEDFYDRCPEGQVGGGEFCYDPASDRYTLDTYPRVNNNRVVLINSENPMQHNTLGYGRVRIEQDDLRAIATPIGGGARAQSYRSSLATQNYAAFLQDRVQLRTNLYLSAGVRWEVQDMRDVLGNRALLIWDNIAPRVGLTYDWTDEGKSRLYASYGQFYRQLPLQLNSRVFGGLVTVRRSYRLSDCTGTVNIDGVDHPFTRDGQPTEYCPDNNQSTTGLTPGVVVPRLRGQFNHRFQLGYDQEVVEDLVVGVSWLHNGLGRAVEDVSTNGGLNYIIANPGEAVSEQAIAQQQAECDRLQLEYDSFDPGDELRNRTARELSRCTFTVDAFDRIGTMFERPIRNYDAWTLRFTKRFAKRWLLYASYTYSRLIGNYDGSLDRDTGAVNLGASTQYDTPELVRNSFGPLYDNRPHLLKLDGSYQFDLGDLGRLSLGTSFRFASGTPINLRADNSRYNGLFLIYVLPRGAGGSTEPLYQWNLLMGYAYPLSGSLELELLARVVNVTNAKVILRLDEVYSYAAARPVAGGALDDIKHAKIQSPGSPTDYYQRTIIPPQGNFGVETAFQRPLAAQFELRLRF